MAKLPALPATEKAPVLNGLQSNETVWDKPYIFRLRRQRQGEFPGLWELTLLDPTDAAKAKVIKTIDDANSLVYCIDNLQAELEGEGL